MVESQAIAILKRTYGFGSVWTVYQLMEAWGTEGCWVGLNCACVRKWSYFPPCSPQYKRESSHLNRKYNAFFNSFMVLHGEHTCSHVNHNKTRAESGKEPLYISLPPFPPLYKRTRGTGNLAKKITIYVRHTIVMLFRHGSATIILQYVYNAKINRILWLQFITMFFYDSMYTCTLH
jgi:hypothetical protein